MNLYFRLFYILVSSLGRPAIHPCEPVVRTFRVLPWDLDAFFHMNNGRYSQIMDVARVDWMRRSRIFDAIVRGRMSGLLGGTLMRFRRALKPFERYRVRTELLGWDSRWSYVEHRFETMDGKLVAVGLSKAGLRRGNDWVDLDATVKGVWPGIQSPELPDRVVSWGSADDMLALSHRSGAPATQASPYASSSIAAE